MDWGNFCISSSSKKWAKSVATTVKRMHDLKNWKKSLRLEKLVSMARSLAGWRVTLRNEQKWSLFFSIRKTVLSPTYYSSPPNFKFVGKIFRPVGSVFSFFISELSTKLQNLRYIERSLQWAYKKTFQTSCSKFRFPPYHKTLSFS